MTPEIDLSDDGSVAWGKYKVGCTGNKDTLSSSSIAHALGVQTG